MKKSVFCASCFLLFFGLSLHAEALCVNVEKANIRSGPGVRYEIVWEVYKYMPFEKIGISKSRAWYMVKDVDGDTSWLHKSLVTNNYRCAVVKRTQAIVRKGPGTRYGKVYWSPAEKYYSLKVLSRKGRWVKVQDDQGDTGWMHKKLLWIR